MKPLLKTVLFAVIFVSATTFVMAKAFSFTLISENEAVVSGVITEINSESFMLDTGEQLFKIDVDDLDLDVPIDSVLETKMKVAVEGRIEGENYRDAIVIEADEILMVGPNIGEKAAAALLISDDPNFNE